MSIKNNTTSLQSLLEAVNALPEVENLDTELSTQANLISEQDAKIAELADILAGKAGGNSSGANIIHASFANDSSTAPHAVWCEDGMTWGDYVDSKYNVIGPFLGEDYLQLYISNNRIQPFGRGYHFISTDGTSSGLVNPSDKIIADFHYICYFDD